MHAFVIDRKKNIEKLEQEGATRDVIVHDLNELLSRVL